MGGCVSREGDSLRNGQHHNPHPQQGSQSGTPSVQELPQQRHIVRFPHVGARFTVVREPLGYPPTQPGYQPPLPYNPSLPPPAPVVPEVTEARTVQNYTNLLKSTAKLKKADEESPRPVYYLLFTVDCSVTCTATIHVMCEEKGVKEGHVSFSPVTPGTLLNPIPSKSIAEGTGIQFISDQPIDFAQYTLRGADATNRRWELVVELESTAPMEEGGHDGHKQYQFTYFKINFRTQKIRAVEQKLQIGSEVFQMEDIYGASVDEEKPPGDTPLEATAVSGDEVSEDNACVICLTEARDTLIMPCRHQCLCSSCAASLRQQTNKCPMCRRPIEGLLKGKSGVSPAVSPRET